MNQKNDRDEDWDNQGEEEEEIDDNQVKRLIKTGIMDHRYLRNEEEKKNVRRSMLGANKDDNMNNTLIINKFDEDLMTSQAKLGINIYKAVTFQIERHLRDPESPFCHIKKVFKDWFENFYSKELEYFKQDSKRDLKQLQSVMNSATQDLQEFVRTLQESIYIYYRLDLVEASQKHYNLLTVDNLINFLTSFFLRDKIYYILFDIQSILDKEHVQKFTKAMELCRKKQPQDFGVPDPFCLNRKTVMYFESLLFSEEKKKLKSEESSVHVATNRNNTEIFHSLHESSISEQR